jgi:MaoC like domain
MNAQLPLLKSLIFPSFLTLTKGVKIGTNGINLSAHFPKVEIDKTALEKYKEFLNWNTDVPLTFFYLMAQRAQTALMLHRDFTIAIPGLVHISNRIEQLSAIENAQPFDLKVQVRVPYKETGSLIPTFSVDFFQNDTLVIRCESTYIAKRKSAKNSRDKSAQNDILFKPDFTEIWDIPKNLGRTYGSASGDKNPIHSYDFFARTVGFRSAILQGWYSVSRIVKDCEAANKTTYKTIEVAFKSPIFLPSQQKIDMQNTDNQEVVFQISDAKTDKVVLNGKVY